MKEIFWELKGALCPVEKNIYGGFVEHLGRNVYGGIYDPASPAADEDGFRKDVLSLIRKLNMPITRYPGGCFSDLYKWEDMVGRERKAFLDPAWCQLEPATFGLDEFLKWAEKAHTEPMITVNAVNRTLMDTAALYEYCNFPGGTYWSDQRRKNGREEPYNVKYWCLGNELYGSWEMGQRSPQSCAECVREHAKVLRNLDPDCQIILCGNTFMPEWNEVMFKVCGPYCDLYSIHYQFYYDRSRPEEEYLRTPDELEKSILEVKKLIENAKKEDPQCRIRGISLDEWILWDNDRTPKGGEKWTKGMHLLEQDYTLLDALVAGQLFSVLQRNSDILKVACIAQSVNVIAPIRTEEDGTCWTQSIFAPFMLSSRFGRGNALLIREEGNEEKDISGSAVEMEDGSFSLFVTNRSRDHYHFSLKGDYCPLEALVLTHEDHTLTNAPGSKDHFQPSPLPVTEKCEVELLPYSWSMIRLRKK